MLYLPFSKDVVKSGREQCYCIVATRLSGPRSHPVIGYEYSLDLSHPVNFIFAKQAKFAAWEVTLASQRKHYEN